MTFFVDTNVIVYAASRSSPYHDACSRVLRSAPDGAGRTSVAVLEEVWHIELRLGSSGDVARDALEVYAPLLPVTHEVVFRALALDLPRRVGTADRLHVATCAAFGIDTIVSADADFDLVPGLRRIDPLDSTALDTLLPESRP